MVGRGVPIVQIHEQWYKENHPGGILTKHGSVENMQLVVVVVVVWLVVEMFCVVEPPWR
jgi:hypothetical protein